jgi:ATP-dependent Lon protease
VIELDELDQLAADSFEGYVVRKDLARKFKGLYPVPTYVGEFLLGRYCATTVPEEIEEGLEIVERLLRERTVRAGEEELFKSRAREEGVVKVIDNVSARLDAVSDSYFAILPSMRLNDARIEPDLVKANDRMLTGGFFAEVELVYDAALGQDSGRPFQVASLRPIQLSTRGALNDLAQGRAAFSVEQWKRFLMRSVGIEPSQLSERAIDVMLLRMVPFVMRNYNAVEVGPRGTGKSHLYQQVSPYAHLVSGGKATVARMFVDNRNGQRGLVAQYDVICFDEIAGVAFDQKDGVQIMKGYMESGEFSRGKESIRAEGSLVLVGNFEVDLEEQLRRDHLFGPLPSDMRNDTAFMDRIHAYLAGWDMPKVERRLFTDHFGLVNDFLAECWSRLRDQSRIPATAGRISLGDALSGRDSTAVTKTLDGLLKLLFPGHETEIPDGDLEWAVRLALECRRRVKEQQKRIGAAEFGNTQFSYRLGTEGPEMFVMTPEMRGDFAEPITVRTPPLDDLLTGIESESVEYKSSMRWDLDRGHASRELQTVIVKSLAGFLNGEGGFLLIGVADDGTPLGIEHDFQTFNERKDVDGWEQMFRNTVVEQLGGEFNPFIHLTFPQKDGVTIALVKVDRSPRPVFVKTKQEEAFYLRSGNVTKPLGPKSQHDYIKMRFG